MYGLLVYHDMTQGYIGTYLSKGMLTEVTHLIRIPFLNPNYQKLIHVSINIVLLSYGVGLSYWFKNKVNLLQQVFTLKEYHYATFLILWEILYFM